MASLKVYDQSGSEVGSMEIESTDIAPSINKQLLHDVVVMYQANQRQGSNKSKTRSEVSGSTKKMYRQKGTGNARAGHRRSGVRRGGGHIFAKQPRDYSYRLPKKAIKLATRMAVASKIQDDQIVVIDELKLDAPKTKDMTGVLQALGLQDDSTLIATNEHDANVYRSARNLRHVNVLPVSDLNALSVLAPKRLLITKTGLESFKNRSASESVS